MKLICLRHPKYTGIGSPDLSCKCCCSMFVNKIRLEQAKQFNNSGVKYEDSIDKRSTRFLNF